MLWSLARPPRLNLPELSIHFGNIVAVVGCLLVLAIVQAGEHKASPREHIISFTVGLLVLDSKRRNTGTGLSPTPTILSQDVPAMHPPCQRRTCDGLRHPPPRMLQYGGAQAKGPIHAASRMPSFSSVPFDSCTSSTSSVPSTRHIVSHTCPCGVRRNLYAVQ